MPRIGETTLTAKLRRLRAESVEVVDDEADDFDSFANGFARSKRGNLYRMFRGMTVTVFVRRDERYSWSIADGEGVRYSRLSYGDEDSTLASLWRELGDADE